MQVKLWKENLSSTILTDTVSIINNKKCFFCQLELVLSCRYDCHVNHCLEQLMMLVVNAAVQMSHQMLIVNPIVIMRTTIT